MAGVRLQITSGVITTSDSPQTLIQIITAAQQGILVYRLQVDIDPNAIASAVVAQLHVEKQTTAGTMTTPSPTWIKKIGPDPETIATAVTHTATVEPTAGDIIGARKLVTIGGTGISTVVFNWPRGLKIDGGEDVGLVITYTAGDPATWSKVTVNGELEE
jgi:hypothetical protein